MLTRRKTLAGTNQNNCWTALELRYFRNPEVIKFLLADIHVSLCQEKTELS
jgi:hypothetical protein